MRTCARIVVATALAFTLAVVIAACGGSSSDSSSSTSSKTGSGSTASTGSGGGKEGGTINVLSGTAPDNLDPQVGYTTQAAEADWLVYTPLVTYKHVAGKDGGTLIPGLATALPTVSADGKTYTATLRTGLKFSDGKPVKASDFKYTIERALKTPWGGKSFYTSNIVGAAEYDKGKAKDISGITVDDASGKITIKLVSPYGGFDNILALPSSGVVPTGTPMKPLPNNPPVGAGEYMFGDISANRGYTLTKNPNFQATADIPAGHADTIDVKISANTESEAQQVLDNQSDVFDWGDTVPPALLQQIKSQASDRFQAIETPSTYYFFLNTTKAPFNNLKARQAVNYGIDRAALQRLTSGFLKPSCYFLPEGLTGHPTSPCPYGLTPNLAKAKQLVKEAGLVGSPITVWGQERQPRRQYIDYYTDLLNKIGFKATEKIIANDTYFPTIGDSKTDPQTGFADWLQDFPNPSDFYLLMDARSIQPTNNQNFSKVNDPKIQTALKKLNAVPTPELDSVASDWQALDEYVAKQAYVATYGAQLNPKFMSNRIDFNNAVFHVLYGNDFSTLQLK